MSSDLEKLRKEIEDVDSQILELLQRRLKLSSKIGEIKRKSGKDVTDTKREEYVKAYWLEKARYLGIPESMVNLILPILFSYSKLYQISPGKKKKIVIFGYGGMSRSLLSLLILAGHNVVVTGRNPHKAQILSNEFNAVYMEPGQAINWGEYIILALSPSARDYILNILSKVPNNKVVMDIFSSKVTFFKEIEEISKKNSFRYVSTHPLFGPILYPVGERIAIIPSVTSGDISEVVEFWRDSGLQPVLTTVEEHEKAMAIVQVLSHFFILGLNKAIPSLQKELEINDKVLKDLQTTNFREVSKIISRVNELYPVIIEIQKTNPYAYKAREIGIKELKQVKDELGE
ncbi:chorismate mutase [Stygiolobus caldivivus]|uniref:Chorismate mutase n=1 Tax=Stygiolobus caldivivus TaxID=2824673 RepID=A0A8D5ZIQ1_9CREN|nr:chorismate mutase [Stygiolobus caldivivus]BCU69467.1 chorismate mutase [Stygiolobus caldivivus]